MTHRHAKTAVLGAGAMGSAAAYHLARRGEPVVLIDQFPPGHQRGSSGGAARITRHSYADPVYARLMLDAFRAWRELERDVCQPLYIRTGGVSICPRSVDYVGRVASSLASIDIPHRRMTGDELNRALPVFGVPADVDVVFEPDAGLIAAALAISRQVQFAREVGGNSTKILLDRPVRRIDLDGVRPTLIFEDEALEVDRLIVSAGAWTSRLLPALPFKLRATRQQVLYFRPKQEEDFEIGRFPAFIYKGEGEDDSFYGMPAALGMGVKAARHWGLETDPDVKDEVIEPQYIEQVRSFLVETLPRLGDAPIDRAEVCLYTVTDEENFRVGLLPGRSDVVVASPCSGHGFKFSCLIGRVLADLATTGETSIAIEPWRIG